MNLDDFQKYLNKNQREAMDKIVQEIPEIALGIESLLDEETSRLFPAPDDFLSQQQCKLSILGVVIEQCIREVPEEIQKKVAAAFAETLKSSIETPEDDEDDDDTEL